MPFPNIHRYARRGDLAGVKGELDAGVNIDLLDELQETPLSTACSKGHIEVVRLLLQHNADIFLKDVHSNTVLLIAIIALKNEIKKLNRDDEREALQERYFEVCKLLLQREFTLRKENPERYKEQLLLLDVGNAQGTTPRRYLQRNLPELYDRLSQLDGIMFNLESEVKTPNGKTAAENQMDAITQSSSTTTKRRLVPKEKVSEPESSQLELKSSSESINNQETALSRSVPNTSNTKVSFWSSIVQAVTGVVSGHTKDEASVPLLSKRHSD